MEICFTKNTDINAIRFLKYCEIFLDKYIKKYDDIINLINREKKNIQVNKWYNIFMNSDLSVSISYFDTIRNDLLRDYYSTITKCKCNENTLSQIYYLTRSNIFSLFIITRSIILNAAYSELYFEFKNVFTIGDEELFDRKFENIMANLFDYDDLDLSNYIDLFNYNSKIYHFNESNKILIKKYENIILGEMKLKGVILNKNSLNDTVIIKNLCFNLEHSFKNLFIKENEIETIFEMSSKSYHRNESYLFYMNQLINKHETPYPTIKTIFRIATISMFLVINQINNLMKNFSIDNAKIESFLKDFKSIEFYISEL